MNPWFRVYTELVDDPKFIKLGPDLRSALLMTWCVAGANDGKLPPLEDVAIKFRLNEQRTKKLLEELERCGWLDRNADGTLCPHNWNGRQYKSDVSTERVKRFRKRERNVSETPPDTEQIQITDTEQKKDAASAAIDPEKAFFDQAANTVGRSLAAKLLKAKGGNVALAHSSLLIATTKSDAKEYLGAIIRGREREGKSEWAF